jgi:hypothetical protein
LFNDEDVELIGPQMPQHVEGSRDMNTRGEVEDYTRKDDDIGKKKRDRAMTTKSKGTPKKRKKICEVELGDSEGEEEAPIKWRDYEIETLIAIRCEMKQKNSKSARKQDIFFCIILIEVYLMKM